MYVDNPSKSSSKKSPLVLALVSLQILISLFIILVYVLAWNKISDLGASSSFQVTMGWLYLIMLGAYVPAIYGLTFIYYQPQFRKRTHLVIILMGWLFSPVILYLLYYVYSFDYSSVVERMQALYGIIPHFLPMFVALCFFTADRFLEVKKPTNPVFRIQQAIGAFIIVGALGLLLPQLSSDYNMLGDSFAGAYNFVFYREIHVDDYYFLFSMITTLALCLPFLVIAFVCKNEMGAIDKYDAHNEPLL